MNSMANKESYYKTLGTTANIGNARIKEKYIEALRKHPPETDPEGFEKVREAYETLKDPEKRKQYDLMRKYGTNLEDLIEKAYEASISGNLKKAKKLLKRANKISPDDPHILMGLMTVAIEQEDYKEMDELFERIQHILPETETKELASIYAVKATFLMEKGLKDLALETLDEAKETFPEESSTFVSLMAKAYIEDGQTEKAWKIVNNAIPTTENETFEDIHFFILLSEMMVQLGKWKDQTKVQSRFRKFLGNLTDEQEKDIAYDQLYEIYEEFYDEGRYREAEFFIDFLRLLDKQDPELKEMKKDAKYLARIQKEIERLKIDEDIFPLIFLQAFEWFYEDIIPPQQLEMMINSLPADILAEMEEEIEMHAAGILRLRKKYPSIYKHYKEAWDEIFEELTEGLNRDMKRELRRLR